MIAGLSPYSAPVVPKAEKMNFIIAKNFRLKTRDGLLIQPDLFALTDFHLF
jgi:hypothetical protein